MDFSLYELLPDLRPLACLDLGALDDPSRPAVWSGLAAAGRAHVIGFEPDMAGYVRLRQKFPPPHQFFPFFVGSGGPAKFHQTAYPDTGSLYPPNVPLLALFNDLDEWVRPVAVHDTTTVRIDDLPEIATVDFMKLDVQGAELDILRGATRALAGTMVVQTEVEFVELYAGQPLFADVDGFLRGQGFMFHNLTGLFTKSLKPIKVGAMDTGLNQKLSGDAIYVRHPLQLDGLPPEKLRLGAAVMHDIYRSYDFALHLLSAADRADGAGTGAAYLSLLAGMGAAPG